MRKKKELVFKSLYGVNLHTNPNLTNKTKFKENKMKRKEATYIFSGYRVEIIFHLFMLDVLLIYST